jgi:hypothetical protein
VVKGMATAQATSRDQVAEAAAVHLSALAWLSRAVHEHNSELAGYRDRLAELGLAVGADFTEGTIADGVRAGGITWTPACADGIVASALREVFPNPGPRNPLGLISPHHWLPSQVEARPDGLAMPTLASVGATIPRQPELPRLKMPDAGSMVEADRIKALERQS